MLEIKRRVTFSFFECFELNKIVSTEIEFITLSLLPKNYKMLRFLKCLTFNNSKY